MHKGTSGTTPVRRRRWPLALGVIAILLVMLVVLAPVFAGWAAPGIIRSRASGTIPGRLDVRSVSLSWFGEQRVRGMTLTSPDGAVVGAGDATVSRGLAPLLLGSRDLGRVTLSNATATIERGPQGTNLRSATVRPGPGAPPGAAPSLPAGFAATIVVENFRATYTDRTAPAAPPVTITQGALEARVQAGRPIEAEFSGRTAAGQGSPGSIKGSARIDSWSRADGTITPDLASVEASVEALAFPVDLLNVLGPPGDRAGSLSQALGRTLDATASVKGSLASATASVEASMPRASLRARLAVADGVLTTTEPVRATMAGFALAELLPRLRQLQAGVAQGAIDSAPDATVTIDKLRLPLPSWKPDLRGAAGEITIGVSETTGRVAVTPGAPMQPFRAAPAWITISTQDLAGEVRATASTELTLDGRPAGRLGADVLASGLLDGEGSLSLAPPRRMEGRVSVAGVATPIAQPFLPEGSIDLPRDVGPTLDLTLAAYVAPGSAEAPITHIDLTVKAQRLDAAGTFRLEPGSLSTRDYGLKIEAMSAGAMIAAFLPADGAWEVRPVEGGGAATITVTDLVIPLGSGGAHPAAAAGKVRLRTAGLRITRRDAGSPAPAPLDVLGLTISGDAMPGAPASIALNASMSHGDARFTAAGAFELEGFLSPLDGGGVSTNLGAVRPTGELVITDAPVALARLFAPAPAPQDQPAADLPGLLADAVGPRVTVRVAATPGEKSLPAAQGAGEEPAPRWSRVTLAITGEHMKIDASGGVSPRRLTLSRTSVEGTVSPRLVERVLSAMGPAAERPRLGAGGRYAIGLAPITIPMQDWKPRLDQGGQADLTLSLPGATLAQGVVLRADDGSRREIGDVGVQDLEVTAGLPLAALFGPAQRPVQAMLKGSLLGAGGARAADFDASASAAMTGGAITGATTARVALNNIDTRLVGPLVSERGVLAGLLGDTASLTLDARLAGSERSPGLAGITGDVSLAIRSPSVETPGPLTLRIRPEAISLAGPTTLAVELDPQRAAHLFAPASDGSPALSLAAPARITVEVRALSVPRGAGGGPVSAEASLAAPALSLDAAERAGDGRASRRRIDLSNVRLDAATSGPDNDRRVDLHLRVASAATEGTPPSRDMTLDATLGRLTDERGAFSLDGARLTASGDLPVIPTALIDSLAHQEGLLVEALGPVVGARVLAEGLPLNAAGAGGSSAVSAVITSERASLTLKGTVEGGSFRASEPARASVLRVTPALSERLLKGIQVAQLEKVPGDDAPATVVATGLVIPLDGNPASINGTFEIDPGEARFAASSIYSRILSMTKIRQSGVVGRRLGPLTVEVRNGVATYRRWSVPLGEFTLETEGSVDFVNRRMDVVAYIPFGALTDEVAGQLNTGLGSFLGRNIPLLESVTMVPFRTRGAFDDTSTAPDMELLAKNVVKTLSPEELIRRGLGGIEDIFKKIKR